MSADERQAIVRRWFNEVCNGRRLDVVAELFAPDHVYHDRFVAASPGPEGMKGVVSPYLAAFPDARWTVDEMHTAGDMVVAHWSCCGTHLKDLPGIAATGRRVTLRGKSISQIDSDKVVESWSFWDLPGLLRQLGVVPSSGEPRA